MTRRSATTKAITFDAAGTLLTVHPSVGDVYAMEAAKHGFDVSSDTLNRTFAACWQTQRPHEGNETPFHTSEAVERAWWRGFVHDVFQNVDPPAEFDKVFDSFFEDLYERFAQPDVWRVYEDVVPTLDGLRERDVHLAVVSNWDSRLPRLLTAIGLAEYFEFILTSAEAGVSKPHPDIFREACRRMELTADAVVHVGDSVEEDIQGARDAGVRDILLDRQHNTSDCTDRIHSLTELLTLPGLFPLNP